MSSSSMSSPPQPPPAATRPYRSISSGSGGSGGIGTPLTPQQQRTSSLSGLASVLPPPPNLMSHATGSGSNLNNTNHSSTGGYTLRMSQSMTIDEMRRLHRHALQEAEAKRTELRLVLASRYRELVGSSDEVLRMKERAKELHDLIHALPDLLLKLQQPQPIVKKEESKEDLLPCRATTKSEDVAIIRRQFSELTRSVHRALDRNQVHLATTTLMELFGLFAAHTNEYPLANKLAAQVSQGLAPPRVTEEQMQALEPMLMAQMRMIFWQVQTLPRSILKSSKENLLQASSYNNNHPKMDPAMGAEQSAAALASLEFLSRSSGSSPCAGTSVDAHQDRATFLLETYFDSKAQLLGSLFNQLTVQAASQAEGILSKIVLILQHDVIIHPYEIFILRKFPGTSCAAIMETLPFFDPTAVQARCSKFLASHLPLIRTKVKSVLVSIAGTTASALGQIRQSLYDKTDGNECQKALNHGNPCCTWDEAVSAVVDVRKVLSHSEITLDRKFSLWSALFSQTFSSLVHSLLTTSFHSVHAKLVTTLRASLSQAPPLTILLPHEAYRNTLRIATDLDQALLKVSDDAHELLVHAEEREESELRLRQSLYVQTSEILGRLLSEIRRIVTEANTADVGDKNHAASDGTRELIVGRLCYFLKFRLTSLPKLLDQESSPVKAQSASTAGMISYVDLESAFLLADDNADGLISFAEAMDAAESAFSGTQFHGSEMLRGTLLLSDSHSKASEVKDYLDVTLGELMLLTSRGLRHGTGQYSALGMVQKALDDIVATCFEKWANAALKPSVESLSGKVAEFWKTAGTTTDEEWQAFHGGGDGDGSGFSSSGSPVHYIPGVSPQTAGFVMNAAFILNRTITPADTLSPLHSMEQAVALGISQKTVPSLTDTLRWTLLRRSLHFYCSIWSRSLLASELNQSNGTAVVQFYVDATFVKCCFLERNEHGFGGDESGSSISKQEIQDLAQKAEELLHQKVSCATLLSLSNKVTEKHRHVGEVCDLFVTSLFGNRSKVACVSAGGELDLGAMGTTQPFCYTPLSSSRRFALLPIQTDRTLADLQLKGAYRKEKEEQERQKETIGGSVMSSGLGFFSSMLKKK